jgi:hypothetical protein
MPRPRLSLVLFGVALGSPVAIALGVPYLPAGSSPLPRRTCGRHSPGPPAYALDPRPAADRHLARGEYHAGRELLQVGQPGPAVGLFAAAVKHHRGLAVSWSYLGEAHRPGGQTGPALEAYRSCLRRDPDHGRDLDALALLEGAK